ncbi:hypothetical protein M405DRAFT_814189 [Rhizopogon salebrosus TDB-379]|nr:hypothetical protein M405DRAFT_814189 [Rhizopogon salebrosus TDB-379]
MYPKADRKLSGKSWNNAQMCGVHLIHLFQHAGSYTGILCTTTVTSPRLVTVPWRNAVTNHAHYSSCCTGSTALDATISHTEDLSCNCKCPFFSNSICLSEKFLVTEDVARINVNAIIGSTVTR